MFSKIRNILNRKKELKQQESPQEVSVDPSNDFARNALITACGLVLAVSDASYGIDRNVILTLVLIMLACLSSYMLANVHRCKNGWWFTATVTFLFLSLVQSLTTGFLAQGAKSFDKDPREQALQSSVKEKQVLCEDLKTSWENAEQAKKDDAERMVVTPHVKAIISIQKNRQACQNDLTNLTLAQSSKQFHGQKMLADFFNKYLADDKKISVENVTSITNTLVYTLFLSTFFYIFIWSTMGMRVSKKKGYAAFIEEQKIMFNSLLSSLQDQQASSLNAQVKSIEHLSKNAQEQVSRIASVEAKQLAKTNPVSEGVRGRTVTNKTQVIKSTAIVKNNRQTISKPVKPLVRKGVKGKTPIEERKLWKLIDALLAREIDPKQDQVRRKIRIASEGYRDYLNEAVNKGYLTKSRRGRNAWKWNLNEKRLKELVDKGELEMFDVEIKGGGLIAGYKRNHRQLRAVI